MSDNLYKELALAKSKVSTIERAIDEVRTRELASLPGKYGYADMAEFIEALAGVSSGRKARASKSVAGGKPAAAKKRKRAVITDHKKSKVAELLKAGKSGSEVAKAVGISLPSVQNIKKELGLVKSRKEARAKSSKSSKASPASKTQRPAADPGATTKAGVSAKTPK